MLKFPFRYICENTNSSDIRTTVGPGRDFLNERGQESRDTVSLRASKLSSVLFMLNIESKPHFDYYYYILVHVTQQPYCIVALLRYRL